MVGCTDLVVRNYILGEWRNLDARSRPPCLWLCLHAPVAFGHKSSGVSTLLVAVWFADRWHVRAESVWTYLRFHTMHQIQPWCALSSGERSGVFGEPHRIGIATYASYEGTAEYWVALQWGVRNGKGLEVRIDPEDQVWVQKQLWVA